MKNYVVGIGLLVLAFYLIWQQGTQIPPIVDGSSNAPFSDSNETGSGRASLPSLNPSPIQETNQSTAVPSPFNDPLSLGEERLVERLENPYSTPVFSNHTGALREVRLHRRDRLSKDYNMTYEGEPLLALSFEDEGGREYKRVLPDLRAFRLVEQTDPLKILYRWERAGELRIEREYSRETNSSYVIHHETRITNLKSGPLFYERMKFHLGSAYQIPRLYNPFDSSETYLNVGYYNAGTPLPEGCSCADCSGRIDGEAEEFFQYNEMGVAGQWESRTLSQARWACVNNQFFINIVRPQKDLPSARISWRINKRSDSTPENEVKGVEGTLSFPLGRLEQGETRSFSFQVYAGPKDYVGLSELRHDQKKVMQFGVFWWISEPLSWLLNKLHSFLGNYGMAIIALTILLKLLLWPLTAKATRSQKKMQALQGPMAKLKEEFKDKPDKLNQEMMKFYKEKGVNPFAGCWPILIQIPIFLGMFWMLRSAAELYGQGFLWANDLSEQDSISVQEGFSLNLLPIVMVATQWFQMKLNPMQMGPEMSEAQRINAKMMRFMPFMFLIFLYFFSSALVLYWTVQNLMTILQTLITKRAPLPGEEEEAEKPGPDSGQEEERPERKELSDEERRYRNLLGLRAKGPIDGIVLEKNYKEKSQNYTSARLDSMSPGKREQALEKKERLEKAYEYLRSSLDKET